MIKLRMNTVFLTLACAVFALASCTNPVEEEVETESEELKMSNRLDRMKMRMSEQNTHQQDTVHLMLLCDDTMEFDQSEITVKEGQVVSMMYGNSGTNYDSKIRHNFVLLAEGTSIPEFAVDAKKANNSEYVPRDSDKVLASTDLMGNSSFYITSFEAPPKGTYDYICSFPGHTSRMTGKFIVK